METGAPDLPRRVVMSNFRRGEAVSRHHRPFVDLRLLRHQRGPIDGATKRSCNWSGRPRR
jgi:hypothetical protein